MLKNDKEQFLLTPIDQLKTMPERLLYVRLLKNLSQSEIAKMCGIKQPSYNSIETGKSKIGSKYMVNIANALGVHVEWLISGDIKLMPKLHENFESSITGEHSKQISSTANIPLINPKSYKTENGIRIDLTQIIEFKSIPSSFFKLKKIQIPNLKLWTMNNNSMSPYINKGDLVGFDISETKILDGEIYFIFFEDEFMIKKIIKEANGVLILSSFNQSNFRDKRVSNDYKNLLILGQQCWRAG